MTNCAIPEGHSLRTRYTEEVMDRLKCIGQVTKTVNVEIENIIQAIEEENWDHVSETLHEIYPLLNDVADKALTAANFAAPLEEKR